MEFTGAQAIYICDVPAHTCPASSVYVETSSACSQVYDRGDAGGGYIHEAAVGLEADGRACEGD